MPRNAMKRENAVDINILSRPNKLNSHHHPSTFDNSLNIKTKVPNFFRE